MKTFDADLAATAKQVYDDAADYIKNMGWCQGVFRATDEYGIEHKCASAAVEDACFSYMRYRDFPYNENLKILVYGTASDYMSEMNIRSFASYNDNFDVSRKDVVNFLRNIGNSIEVIDESITT